MDDVVELPDSNVQIAEWGEPSWAFVTLERGDDGTIYLVSWWYGTATVKCAIYPDGRVWKHD